MQLALLYFFVALHIQAIGYVNMVNTKAQYAYDMSDTSSRTMAYVLCKFGLAAFKS